MHGLSMLLSLAALVAGGVALIEFIPALMQSWAYLFKNVLALRPETLPEIVQGDGVLRMIGPGFLFRFHGMYAVQAVPLFLFAAIALTKAKERHDAEECARKAIEAQELAAARNRVVAAQNRALQLEGLARRATEISKELPRHLDSANSSISLAEREFTDGMLDPFWDAVEFATRDLAEYHSGLSELSACLRTIRELKSQCKADGSRVTTFSIVTSEFSNATPIAARLAAVVRRSQRHHDFTSIFHVRRTNAILIKGFTTFGQALSEMGARISAAINDVNASVSSLENAVQLVGSEVTSAINDSTTSHRNASTEVENSFERLTSVVQVESDRSARSSEKIVDMLDNIQRDRMPADLDYKPGTVKRKG
jgi:hypothetical protein